MTNPTQQEINRLFQLAELLMSEVQGTKKDHVEVLFDDATGMAEVGGVEFDSGEVVDAMQFLIRAGYLEPA